jgi:hypothetical protein
MRKWSFIMRVIAASTLAILVASAGMADTLKADVWADNWFAFYLNGQKIAEDSVSITTERSFNAESFQFSAEKPYVLGFVVKDFKENDSGLEYIGSRKQQMGDGGFIAQFTSGSQVVAVTDGAWKCLVTHDAPAQKSCAKSRNPVAGQGACGFTTAAEPDGWGAIGFDDSGWSNAVEYSERTVRPKDGYDRINWDRSAKLIWGPDLETNNTLLCRLDVK